MGGMTFLVCRQLSWLEKTTGSKKSQRSGVVWYGVVYCSSAYPESAAIPKGCCPSDPSHIPSWGLWWPRWWWQWWRQWWKCSALRAQPPRLAEKVELPRGHCPWDPPTSRRRRSPDISHPRGSAPTPSAPWGAAPPKPLHLGGCAPKPLHLGAAPPYAAVASLLDYNVASLNIHR